MKIAIQPFEIPLQSLSQLNQSNQNQEENTKRSQNINNTYHKLFPLRFGSLLTITPLSWQKFKGKVQYDLPYYAHIYWNINYQLSNDFNPKISINVQVLDKSWVKQGYKQDNLLNHQQGHLLIGYLCALQFVRRIHKSNKSLNNQYARDVFNKTLKHYQKIQRQYDDQTQHMQNQVKQKQWDVWIKEKLLFYRSIFSIKKGKFVRKTT